MKQGNSQSRPGAIKVGEKEYGKRLEQAD